MLKYTTLSQFVDNQIEKFNLEDNKKTQQKLWRKFSRDLIELNLWDNAETRLIGRKQTKVFTHDELDKLYRKVEQYLIKLSPYDTDELNKQRESNLNILNQSLEEFSQEHYEKELKSNGIDLAPKVNQAEINHLMLKSLFEVFYEPLNIDQWNKDKEFMHYADTFDEEVITSFEFIQAQKRINNPEKFYVTRKKD